MILELLNLFVLAIRAKYLAVRSKYINMYYVNERTCISLRGYLYT